MLVKCSENHTNQSGHFLVRPVQNPRNNRLIKTIKAVKIVKFHYSTRRRYTSLQVEMKAGTPLLASCTAREIALLDTVLFL